MPMSESGATVGGLADVAMSVVVHEVPPLVVCQSSGPPPVPLVGRGPPLPSQQSDFADA
jgi:hypothetical protein